MKKGLVHKIVIWTLLLLSIIKSEAQDNSIKGKIYLDETTPAVHSLILLEDVDNEVYDAVYSDNTGRFTLQRDSLLSQIAITYIGYKTLKISNASLKKNTTFYLEKLEYRLDDIELSAKKIYTVTKGDTTNYNFNYYTQKTDHDLSDALNRMDGIHVSNQKVILYKNKKIDKLLIEGKDILNDHHKLTIENIAPVDVSKIQIIENYQAFHEKFTERLSDKVALNILLTEKAKLKINGHLKSGVGYKKIYELNSNVYSANGKRGFSSVLKSNNRGNQTVTINDFMNMQSSLLRTLNQTNGDVNKIIPPALLDKQNQNYDLDNLLAVNYERKYGRKNEIKLSNVSNYTHRGGNAQISRIYFQEVTPLIGADDFSEKLLFNYNVINYKCALSKSALLEIDIPSKQQLQLYANAFKSNNQHNASSNQEIRHYSYNPQLFYSKKLDAHNTFKLEYSLNISRDRRNISLSSNQHLFGTDKKTIHQEIHKGYTRNYLKPEWQYRKKGCTIGLATQLYYTSHNHLYSKINTPNTRRFRSEIASFQPRLEMKLNINKILLRPALDIHIVSGNSNKTKISKQFFNPSLIARYSFSKLNYLLITAKVNNNVYEVENFFDAREIVNNNTLNYHYINNQNTNQKINSISLLYLYVQPSKFRVNSTISYNKTYRSLFFINELKENYFISKADVTNKTTHLTYMFNLEKRVFSNQIVIRPTFNYSQSYIDHTTPVSIKNIKLHLDLVSNFKSSFNATVGIQYDHLSQRFNELENQFSTLRLYKKIRLSKGRFLASIEGTLTNIYTKSKHTYFYNLGFNWDYKFGDRWNFYVSGKDIFNINQRYIQGYEASMTYIQTSTYKRQPGNVLLGVKYTF